MTHDALSDKGIIRDEDAGKLGCEGDAGKGFPKLARPTEMKVRSKGVRKISA